MKRTIASGLFLAALALSMLACGLGNIQFVESPNLALTVTAQALALQQVAPAAAAGQNPAPAQCGTGANGRIRGASACSDRQQARSERRGHLLRQE